MDPKTIETLTQTPAHLAEDMDALRQGALAAADASQTPAGGAAKAKAGADPKMQERYTFSLDWKDPHGRTYQGQFTNKILPIRERQASGVLRAQLNGGLPREAVDDLTTEVNLMLAHLAFSLVEVPAWAKDLRALTDTRVVYAIYEEVASHEATFLGWSKGESESEPRQ